METNLIKNNQSNQSLEVRKERIQEIGKEVYQINQVISFPMNDIQIEDMTKSIIELCPEIEPRLLKNIIDDFKIGKLEWDKNVNIQNIFREIPKIFLKESDSYTDDIEKKKYYYKLYTLYSYKTGQTPYNKSDWEEEDKW